MTRLINGGMEGWDGRIKIYEFKMYSDDMSSNEREGEGDPEWHKKKLDFLLKKTHEYLVRDILNMFKIL